MTIHTVEVLNGQYDLNGDGQPDCEVYVLADIDDSNWTVSFDEWGVRELSADSDQ